MAWLYHSPKTKTVAESREAILSDAMKHRENAAVVWILLLGILQAAGVQADTGFVRTMPEDQARKMMETPNQIPEQLKDVGISDKTGAQISTGALTFNDETGSPTLMSGLMQPGKPTILTLVYYDCPNLCNFLLNGVVDSLKALQQNNGWALGKQFNMISVSIDPKEGPALAVKKKLAYLGALREATGSAPPSESWRFLTGNQPQIDQLAREVGFGFKYDAQEKQFAHGAAIFVLTPEGKISRTLYGITFAPTDLKLSLLEASAGKVGTVIDRIMLFCYHYNPTTKKYSVLASRLMQLGAYATVFILGGYLAAFWIQQRRTSRSAV